MDFYYWLAFAGTVFAVSLIPGPSTLLTFAHGARFGWGMSLYTSAGNCTASVLQAIIASAGLGIVIASSAILFLAIKYAGAAYLIYLGLLMWRSSASRVALGQTDSVDGQSRSKLFRSGFLVAAGNPKAIAFFTALFPQFLSHTDNGLVQLSGMVCIVGLAAFSVAAAYGCLGAWIKNLQFSKRVMGRVYKSIGGLFIASGFGLAIARN
jgi:homoserine/homoserine lactone efflux protein